MIRLVARAFPQNEWDNLVSGFHDLSLMQTWEYAEAKARTGPWKVERLIFVDGEYTVGAVQAMVRQIPGIGGGLVWINQGPLWRKQSEGDVSALVAMLSELRRYWVDERHMYLRITPPIYEGELDVTVIQASGYDLADGVAGWASAIVDLSKSEEQLRKDLRIKWRGDLNSAERHEVSCVDGRSGGLI